MPLPQPILDDRSYQQLRDELIRRIPIYAPEWTDHNPSDPGVTLVELFAFLGENLLYRFNQIPETTRLAFLRLLQFPMRPAAAASVMLALTTEQITSTLAPLGTVARAGDVGFETGDEADVLPVEVRAVARLQSDLPQGTGKEIYKAYADLSIAARGGLKSGEKAGYYVTGKVTTTPAAADAAPVDFGATVDGMVWIAVLAATDKVGLDELRASLAGRILNLGFVPDEQPVALAKVSPCPGTTAPAKAPAVAWEISTGRFDPPNSPTGRPLYSRLQTMGDTTRGLQQQGVVRLELPAKATAMNAFALTDPDLRGTGDLPPALEDEELEKKLLFWVRGFRDDQGPLPRVLWIGANAAEARQVVRARPEFLGTGTGQPDQRWTLVHHPVVAASLRLEVEEPAGWRSWQEVEGFWASGEDDRHFVLDAEAGEVRFGNAVRGMAPQIGWRIRASEYLYGGGAQGNVPAKAITRLEAGLLSPGIAVDAVKVENPLPARYGAPGETISEALERLPGELRRRDRAVTASDFQELAYATPGADIGRVDCIPLFYPPTQDEDAAGVVSVMVWPREDAKHPNAPMPDRSLLRAVCEWLDQRRLITTELYVVPPVYRKVAVSVGVQVKPGFGASAVRRWVELILRQYLAPLPPYGPEGRGWPLGRRVYGPELEAAVLQVEGVQYVIGLSVAGRSTDDKSWVAGTVDLKDWEVPELTEIAVVDDREPLPVGTAVQPPGSPKVPVPVPIVKEEC